ncbi:MAG: hypothetical protein IJC10_01710 [Clostridia bacterium]|nr:hypothetical protein [Clostridia bacterium]
MHYKVSNLKLSITSSQDEVFCVAQNQLGLSNSDVISRKILRKSVDARHKQVDFIYSVLIETNKKVTTSDNVVQVEIKEEDPIVFGTETLLHRPVIVGFGPCGMFCALTLARQGYRPIVIERGAKVDERTKKIEHFWATGELDTNTNVQFGEGGAGTFSDGKLTCRNGDPLIDGILQDFVNHGAPEDILYSSLPHIGTDILKSVVKSIREEIIALGGAILFNTAVCDINITNSRITSLSLSDGNQLPCQICVFAIGHSARDTYEMLYKKGLKMIAKTFSVGVRAEHLQRDIDEALYGDFAGHPSLGAASYKVSCRENNIGCYSFCMCPGGTIVTASSEEGMVVVNGMSNRARDNKNSNSAICINVTEKDFGKNPMDAIEFQRDLERRAYSLGGSNYSAPVQTLGDYIDGVKTTFLGKVSPSVTGCFEFADLNNLFTPHFNSFLKRSFREFDKKIHGFANRDTILTGVETRTSAPVRILRNDDFISGSVEGLMPAGEGAGYAGGIMSAAVDGVKCAVKIMNKYKPS